MSGLAGDVPQSCLCYLGFSLLSKRSSPPSSAFQGASTLTGILLTLVVILAGLHLPAGLSGVLMQTLPFSDSIFQNYCTLTNIEERLAEPIMFGNCLISDHKG